MPNSKNDNEGFFHDIIHRLFQKNSRKVSLQNYSDYKFETKFDYRIESFTDEEIEKIKVVSELWNIPDVRITSIIKNDAGFRVTIYSNLPNGQSLGKDLFSFLAKKVFREMNKIVAYLQVRE